MIQEQDFWVEVVRQIPALGVLVFLVLRFLGHMQQCQDAENKRTERVATVLDKYTEVMGRVSECLARSNDALDDAARERRP